jgi:hypothetical protein
LLEGDYLRHRTSPVSGQVEFWLKELRTPELLVEVCAQHPERSGELAQDRPLLVHAVSGDLTRLSEALEVEEKLEREKDRLYWLPLKEELERMRHPRQP